MQKGTAESYVVFVRNWWRWEYKDIGTHGTARRLVPDPKARKTTLARGCTADEARMLCEQYAATHKPGPLSRKAEFERE